MVQCLLQHNPTLLHIYIDIYSQFYSLPNAFPLMHDIRVKSLTSSSLPSLSFRYPCLNFRFHPIFDQSDQLNLVLIHELLDVAKF
jgi:hypothetical protein